jgi:SAM-dependent methyltransferase
MALRFPIEIVRVILDRFPRPGDALEQQARERLRVMQPDEANPLWEELCLRVLLNPVYLGFLWPDVCAQHPNLRQFTRGLQEQVWVPALSAQTETASAQWVLEQGDADAPGTLMCALLAYLETFNPASDSTFGFLSRYYTWRDIVVSQLVAPERMQLLDRLFGLLDMQAKQWGKPYCAGYAYQGYARIGLAGVKPTEVRLQGYDFLPWLKPNMRVLEIGCNNGFMAIELARHVGQVDAVEYNPFLVEIGRVTAAVLEQTNVHFEVADFGTWQPRMRYSVVLSFANHCTIDGNLSVEFESFVAKLWQITDDDGWLLFESHNVFGPGSGAPGDDGDLDRKFDVMERYFELLDSKMTKTFVPSQDIDKLFVVLRRRSQVLPLVERRMNLIEARKRYSYVGAPFA